MGMEDEPEWHIALENGTLAKLPLNKEGSAYVLDSDGITVKELWDSLDLPQLWEVHSASCATPQHCRKGHVPPFCVVTV